MKRAFSTSFTVNVEAGQAKRRSSLKPLKIIGTVFTGKGDGAKYVGLSWIAKLIGDRFGFTPYVGTLNLRLADEMIKFRARLEKETTIETVASNGFCRGLFFGARVKEVECVIVIPQVADYPNDVLEIIAPINLRKRFQLEDGDFVEIDVRF